MRKLKHCNICRPHRHCFLLLIVVNQVHIYSQLFLSMLHKNPTIQRCVRGSYPCFIFACSTDLKFFDLPVFSHITRLHTSLRKKRPYLELFWSVLFRPFMQSESGKIRIGKFVGKISRPNVVSKFGVFYGSKMKCRSLPISSLTEIKLLPAVTAFKKVI